MWFGVAWCIVQRRCGLAAVRQSRDLRVPCASGVKGPVARNSRRRCWEEADWHPRQDMPNPFVCAPRCPARRAHTSRQGNLPTQARHRCRQPLTHTHKETVAWRFFPHTGLFVCCFHHALIPPPAAHVSLVFLARVWFCSVRPELERSFWHCVGRRVLVVHNVSELQGVGVMAVAGPHARAHGSSQAACA